MRKLWIVLAVLVLIIGAAVLLTGRQRNQWTTSSPEALAAFEKGWDSRMKYYADESVEYFRHALELDPDFTAAKLALMSRVGKNERSTMLEDLRETDLNEYCPREQFLVKWTLAEYGDKESLAAGEKMVYDYLDRYPEDPYALSILADLAWGREEWRDADAYYQRLIAADPNWVLAQNRLGYIALGGGQFEEAEQRFKTYKYIAPDQANPHDSMGELLTILGRYDEAIAELEESVRIRPDFCASYSHLIDLAIFSSEAADGGLSAADRAAEHCSAKLAENLRCRALMWNHYHRGELEAGWEVANGPCLTASGDALVLGHRLAVLTGRDDAAMEIEESVQPKKKGKQLPHSGLPVKYSGGISAHVRAVRLAHDGEFEEAIRLFREADEELQFWGDARALFKLFNLQNLAATYQMAGYPDEAESTMQIVRSVNPRLEPTAD